MRLTIILINANIVVCFIEETVCTSASAKP